MALPSPRRSYGVLFIFINAIVYAAPQAGTGPPICTLSYAAGTVAKVCNCKGGDTPLSLLDDPSQPDACAYTALPDNSPSPTLTGDTDSFNATLTTVTNSDGSFFTAILETTTDPAGAVSTITATLDAVAGGDGGEPVDTQTLPSFPPSSPIASTISSTSPTTVVFPALFTTVVSGVTETLSQTIFPDLVTVTAPVTVTTAVVETNSDGVTTTTPVPIVIGPGGVGYVGPLGPLPPDVPFPPPSPPGSDPPTSNPGSDDPGRDDPSTTDPPTTDSPTTDSHPTDSPTCTNTEVPQCTASCVDDGTSATCTTTVCTTTTACDIQGFTSSVTRTTTLGTAPTIVQEVETARPTLDDAVDVLVQVYLTSLYSAFGATDIDDTASDVSSTPPTSDANPPVTTSDADHPITTTSASPPTTTAEVNLSPSSTTVASCAQLSDCPQSACNSDQTAFCDTFHGVCVCGQSTLDLGPLGRRDIVAPTSATAAAGCDGAGSGDCGVRTGSEIGTTLKTVYVTDI